LIKLGYGLITCQTHPDDPPDWQTLYTDALKLAKIAESSGAESIWVSEHHFTNQELRKSGVRSGRGLR
jgi:alkanesulfonate monooxygenase SsuD/methylene tetrahydromethanopterin reductase-like flavin-dependent oxidoreductase (luciferase family)